MFLVCARHYGFRDISVKINGSVTPPPRSPSSNQNGTFYPDYPFEYQFLDDHFDCQVYKADNQVSQIVGILAGLAIFISCLEIHIWPGITLC